MAGRERGHHARLSCGRDARTPVAEVYPLLTVRILTLGHSFFSPTSSFAMKPQRPLDTLVPNFSKKTIDSFEKVFEINCVS